MAHPIAAVVPSVALAAPVMHRGEPYDCAECWDQPPTALPDNVWGAAWVVFAYAECEGAMSGENWCVRCEDYGSYVEELCNTDNVSEIDNDVVFSNSEQYVIDWYWDWRCERHLCEEPDPVLLESLVATANVRGLRELLISEEGKLYVNKERGLLQSLNCRGYVTAQYDLTSKELRVLLADQT
jgi:hypothetical protein